MEAKSIDDVIIASENQQLASLGSQQPNDNVVDAIEPSKPQEEPKVESQDQIEVKQEVATEPEQTDSPIDEYGNPVEKPKMYSEEEVNKLIRDRLARGKYAEQAQPVQQPQQQSEQQEEDWEKQFEALVDKTIDKRQAKLKEQQWRQQELAKQAEFEDKFFNGMAKYSDFIQVVSGKSITDAMVKATRKLDNPAAFIYAASKMHASELERISKIDDEDSQKFEIGRLHERMIKSKSVVSSAPKPVEVMSSDMPIKNVGQFPSLEERIDQYARQKRK